MRTRRLLLTGSVIAALSASSGVVLTLPDRLAGADATPAVAPSAAATSTTPPDAAVPPPVTGADIAASALTPARERAAALADELARLEQEQAAAAERERAERERAAAERRETRWRNVSPQMRAAIRKACAEGRIRGAVCESA